MKPIAFTVTTPFLVKRPVKRDSGDARAVGYAVGWALMPTGYVVPVFSSHDLVARHGDFAVVHHDNAEHVFEIGDEDRYGEALFPIPEKEKSPGRPRSRKPEPERLGPYGIGFGQQTYKLTSSWHFRGDGDSPDFLFQVPGTVRVPDDERCEKVNRDTFLSLSKTVPVKDYDEVIGEKAPDEPEAEDDEAMDMV